MLPPRSSPLQKKKRKKKDDEEGERGREKERERGREGRRETTYPSTTVLKTLPRKLWQGGKKEQWGSLRGGLTEQVIKSAEKTSHVSIRSLNQHSGKKQYFQTF